MQGFIAFAVALDNHKADKDTFQTAIKRGSFMSHHRLRIPSAAVVLKTAHLKGGGFNPIYKQ